jgi:hypothetical protein
MSTLRLTTISNQDGSATVPSQTVISGSAKAWVNFNGTGTVAIRASFNVTSITDGGAGIYTVNFTTAMSDTNYCVMTTSRFSSSSGNNQVLIEGLQGGTSSTGSVTVVTTANLGSTAGMLDVDACNVSVFR